MALVALLARTDDRRGLSAIFETWRKSVIEASAKTAIPAQTAIGADTAPIPDARVPVGSALYNRVLEFLYEEAALLDQIRLKEWGALLAPDLLYTAPLRETRPMDQQNSSLVRTVQHFHDDWRDRKSVV